MGFPPVALVSALRKLEVTRNGPALIVVTDHPVYERRAFPREQPIIVTTFAEWQKQGLDLLPLVDEESRPELPFTD